MRITQEQLDEWLRKNPSLSIDGEDCAKRVCSTKPELSKGKALECHQEREEKGSIVPPCRYRITFSIHAVSPCDFDNYFCKPVQDLLVQLGFIPDDAWNILEGCVRSFKAKSKEEERTEILIEPL